MPELKSAERYWDWSMKWVMSGEWYQDRVIKRELSGEGYQGKGIGRGNWEGGILRGEGISREECQEIDNKGRVAGEGIRKWVSGDGISGEGYLSKKGYDRIKRGVS